MRLGYNFNWETAPLRDFQFAFAVASIYALLVLVHYCSPSIQKAVTIPNTKIFVSLHNLILMVASIVMFIGCLWEVVQRSLEEHSISWFQRILRIIFCNSFCMSHFFLKYM